MLALGAGFRLAAGAGAPTGGLPAALDVAALIAAALLWATLAASARLPARWFLPLAVATGWVAGGAPPLWLWWPEGVAFDWCRGLLGAALAAVGFTTVRRNDPGHRCWAGRDTFPPRPHAVPRALAVALTGAVVVPLLAAGVGIAWSLAQLERATAGFVRFGADRIEVEARRYRRADRAVELVGMVHIGERAAYEDIFGDFETTSTVVLEEGIGDREERLSERLSYTPLSDALGLGVQPSLGRYLAERHGEIPESRVPDIRRADLDLSDFSPETLEVLREAARVYDSADLDQALSRLQAFGARRDAETLLAAAREDLITRRDRHLVGELDDALEDYERVVVPWGAIHMRALEGSVLQRGFERIETRRRTIVRYATLLAALLGSEAVAVPSESVR
ncbi:MAG: hypothetical protein QNK03_17745 [Myxococcota bacterium]|nr:hypothetical protein [Myxococcota bacterium]